MKISSLLFGGKKKYHVLCETKAEYMTHFTVDGKFETAAAAIKNVQDEQLTILKPVGDRKPVVVATKISGRKTSYGVQYWTDTMIQAGCWENTDRTIAAYCK